MLLTIKPKYDIMDCRLNSKFAYLPIKISDTKKAWWEHIYVLEQFTRDQGFLSHYDYWKEIYKSLDIDDVIKFVNNDLYYKNRLK